jgi:hypothetical protein
MHSEVSLHLGSDRLMLCCILIVSELVLRVLLGISMKVPVSSLCSYYQHERACEITAQIVSVVSGEFHAYLVGSHCHLRTEVTKNFHRRPATDGEVVIAVGLVHIQHQPIIS